MIWQDWILGLSTIVFSLSLLPSILGKDKPAIPTSLLTGITLIMVVYAQASLELWLTATASTVACILWLTLAVQKYQSK